MEKKNKQKFIQILLLYLFFMMPILGFSRDIVYYKGEQHSLVDWDNIDISLWSDYYEWLNISRQKEKLPDWEVNLRDGRLQEEVGRVLECVGECRIFRDQASFNVKYRSRLMEGDELRTIGESYLWVFLYDGSMLRLSPKSSISFKEINIGIDYNFHHARINSGNVLWLSRNRETFKEVDKRETDTIFFPLEFRESRKNRILKEVDEKNLFSLLDTKDEHLRVYRRLNKLIKKNNKAFRRKNTKFFIVLPNGSVVGRNISMEFIVLIGGRSYIKNRSQKVLGLNGHELEKNKREINIFMRGFENLNFIKVEDDLWYEIGEKGRKIEEYQEPREFRLGEFVTKRTPSIMIARELLLEKYSMFAYQEIKAKLLGGKFGYRQWEKYKEGGVDDLTLRISFLKEFTRRHETQNLVVSEIFTKRKIRRGEKIKKEIYDHFFFRQALANYSGARDLEVEIGLEGDVELSNSTSKKYWKFIHE